MIFAGRKIETNKIIKELQQGYNVILEGKYGIGRTSLIRHTASLLVKKWRFIFVDFSQTPGQMSKVLMKELGLTRKFKHTSQRMGYKSRRYRIANVASKGKIKTVIVLDNIAKITAQKIIFLRHLILEQHFQFIAIVEHFLPQKDLFLIKAQLLPATSITLRHLTIMDIENYLQNYSDQYHLNWTDEYIHNLAALTDGYPLNVMEMLKKKREGRPDHT